MKIAYFKHILSLGCLAAAATVMLGSCGKSDIDTYTAKNKVWFTQRISNPQLGTTYVNNLTRSFSLYPGYETLDVSFEVNLIGNVVDYDRTYEVVVVDSLTTAVPTEYEIHPTIIPANAVKSNCEITLKKSSRMAAEQVKLTLHIVENETFEPGYTTSLQVCVNFNDITTKPDWWTDEITKSYFGEYSKAKFDAFFAFTEGRNTIDDLSRSDLRKLLLGFKQYIVEEKITEIDGSEMIIPIY